MSASTPKPDKVNAKECDSMAPVGVLELDAVPGDFGTAVADLSRPSSIVFVLERDGSGET